MGALVSIVALRFQLQTTHVVRWRLLQRWDHFLCRRSFSMPGHYSRIPRLPANMDAIFCEKATNASETSDEPDTYCGSGWDTTCSSTLHCKAHSSICSDCQYRQRGLWSRGYASTEAGTKQRHEELYASTQQGAGTQQWLEEFVIMRHFSNLAS